MKTKIVRTPTSGRGYAGGQRKLVRMRRKGWVQLATRSASLGRYWLQDNYMVKKRAHESLPLVPGGWTVVVPPAVGHASTRLYDWKEDGL
jgi:hypothetical protein